MRILSGLFPLLLVQCQATKPWIWTEPTPSSPEAPNPRLPSHGFGARIAVLEDLDRDGVADLAISAPIEAFGRESGSVYVVSGLDGHRIRRITDPDGCTGFGTSLQVCTDVDFDGFPDLVVGSHGNCTCVVSPRSGKVLRSFHDRSAMVVADVDGDGVPDFVTGRALECDEDRHDHRGFVSAVSGCDETELYRVRGDPARPSGDTGFQVDGFGESLCVLGDLDGDGVADFAAGVPGFLRNQESVGAVRFFSGRTGATLFVAAGPLGPNVYGAGRGLLRTRDLDGDGIDDLLVASDDDYPVFALSSRTGEVLLTFRHALSDGYLDGFGDSFAITGDLDQDGAPDFAIGCSEFLIDEGDAYSIEIFSGTDGHFLLGLDADRRHVIVGESRDFDRDGLPDLPVGLPELDEVLILSGRGLRSRFGGPVIPRAEWPVLRAIRRADLEK